MSSKRTKALRRKFIAERGQPKPPQYNIKGEVVEKDEWREYKKLNR